MTNEQFPTTHGAFYLLANIGRPGCFVNSETMEKAKRLGLIDESGRFDGEQFAKRFFVPEKGEQNNDG